MTLWYAGIFTTIAVLCGLGFYEVVVRAYRITIDGELKTVAGTVHDSLETVLKQPGKIETSVTNLLPNLLFSSNKLFENSR